MSMLSNKTQNLSKIDNSYFNLNNSSFNTSNVSFLNQSANHSLRSPGKMFAGNTSRGGDRFIPSRKALNFSTGGFLLSKQMDEKARHYENLTPRSKERSRNTELMLRGKLINEEKVLSFHSKPSDTSLDHRKKNRSMLSRPIQSVEAKAIVDNDNFNLVDWGARNLIALALQKRVVLWNPDISETTVLTQMPDTVCSVAWSADGKYLAIGDVSKQVSIWDVGTSKKIRSHSGYSSRPSILAWRDAQITCGTQKGEIVHQDLKSNKNTVFKAHNDEISGLSWCPKNKILATGGNDNKVHLWNIEGDTKSPLMTFNEHKAAVKSIQWCPWKNGILVTAGGFTDHKLRVWNTRMGQCIDSIDMHGQTTSLLCNKHHKEYITAHGDPKPLIKFWDSKTFDNLCHLSGHKGRILKLSQSPDHYHMLSLGADEVLNVWKICDVVAQASEQLELSSTLSKLSILR